MKKQEKKFRYPIKSIRISSELWNELQEKRKKRRLSWNLFLEELNKNYDEGV